MDQLYNLWNAVSPGGWVIVDDYSIHACRQALDEFFARHGLAPAVVDIDSNAAWFQKPAGPPVDGSWYTAFNASRPAEGSSKAGKA